MKTTIRATLAALVLAAAWGTALAAGDSPALEGKVKSGELPAVDQRLPNSPLAVDVTGDAEPGRHGGDLRMLMGKSSDIRMVMVYGYARLVAFNQRLELEPDILESYEVKEGREFTFRLRKGHKWSDGHPFTSEDFRYYWEDIANNDELSPFGPPRDLLVDGEPPTVEFPDELTVRYTWPGPNPHLLTALAGARPLFIYRPAHSLRQFHASHADAETLKSLVRRDGSRNWAGLHHRLDNQYKMDNPDLPVLQPWHPITPPPSDRFIFERNPYYHRVDQNGLQLPYIDRVIVNISDKDLVPAKTGAGDTDLQARYLRFDNYTFLKGGEKRNDYTVRLWKRGTGNQVALYPNLNVGDPVWREIVRDARFRRALSLAIDRTEINQIIYFGLAQESNNTVRPESPLFQPEFQTEWATFDVAAANAMLDELGLKDRDSQGMRKLPNGQTMEIIVDTAGESTEETDVLELIRESWAKIGIKLFTKPSQREIFRNRVFSGDSLMSVWSGLDNGVPTADMAPIELAPTQQVQLQWPKWGQHYETSGEVGEEPEMPEIQELLKLMGAWTVSTNTPERADIWSRMLAIHAEQTFTIGTVSGVLQPVVVSNRLRNVPAEGIYNWDPGAFFGIYRPEIFWFAGAK